LSIKVQVHDKNQTNLLLSSSVIHPIIFHYLFAIGRGTPFLSKRTVIVFHFISALAVNVNIAIQPVVVSSS
jgi:hypothetical protein